MILEIDFECHIPIYEQIERQIVNGIAQGKLKKGESLPSVRQMAEDIGINLHTVNKAYNDLKNSGYLNMDRRRGTVVNDSFPKAGENLKKQIYENLNYSASRAAIGGINYEEFSKMCREIFENIKL